KKFRVLEGHNILGSTISWSQRPVDGVDGAYRVRQVQDYSGNLVKIEAEGYLPAVSRNVKSDEGKVTIRFELKKGKDLVAMLLAPDGKPAAGAKVVLGIADSQIIIRNGDIDDRQTRAAQTASDESGRFHFSPQSGEFEVVITHPRGMARVIA